MLEVDQRENRLLQKAIAQWQETQLINREQAEQLQQSLHVRANNIEWQTITLYIFIAAISCALMAFGSLVLDEKWIEVLRKKLSLTDGIISVLFALLTIFLAYNGFRRKQAAPSFSLNRELYWLLPILSTGVTVVYLGKSLQYLGGNYGLFWLLATFCYGVLALAVPSRLLWTATLLCLAPAYVKLTYYITGDASWFLGMNLPCRLFLLAVVMLALHRLALPNRRYHSVGHITWAGGWLLLLLSAWLISIFGNSGTWSEWQQLRQVRLIWWVAGYTVLCGGVVLLGIKRRDAMVRDMGVIFLLLDMYTRYFEYLWDRTHKGLFFTILALSFWWIGRRIEKWKKV
ncbi:hypothetical protein F0L74_23505 [Chitinophaga agrisoli]|uniref:Membrane protein DUF2157 n=1 Tax=Chitinophaga agrisoli TaxID=2607653 RepID=A0A5B2VKY1_9BACT|nr:hypothetical protein [Chitinophaga agrisoli]KAA2239176.1 hypothetical protein F0L74_23505 [Chitinophaga agrisoli]